MATTAPPPCGYPAMRAAPPSAARRAEQLPSGHAHAACRLAHLVVDVGHPDVGVGDHRRHRERDQRDERGRRLHDSAGRSGSPMRQLQREDEHRERRQRAADVGDVDREPPPCRRCPRPRPIGSAMSAANSDRHERDLHVLRRRGWAGRPRRASSRRRSGTTRRRRGSSITAPAFRARASPGVRRAEQQQVGDDGEGDRQHEPTTSGVGSRVRSRRG